MTAIVHFNDMLNIQNNPFDFIMNELIDVYY